MAHQVALVTDSTACLPPSVVAEHGIRVVPLHVVVDGEQRDEPALLALPEAELVTLLCGAKKLGTSRPSPGDFLAAYERAIVDGASAIVSVHLSGGLSGTVDAAILAASRVSVPVEVVDTRQGGMGVGYAVLAAAAAASGPGSAAEVAAAMAAAARASAAESTSLFVVDSLDHLRRGGRVTAGAQLVGSAFAIKPILALDDGVIEPHARVRTAARAVDRLVQDAGAAVAELTGSSTSAGSGAESVAIAVQSLGADERAQQVADRLRDAWPQTTVERFRLGAVLGAHVGPGTVGVVVAPSPR